MIVLACLSTLIPAAFSQEAVSSPAVTFDCPVDECLVAPYFKGGGGFVGILEPGVDEASFFITCGSTGIGQVVKPESGRVVSGVWTRGNSLLCDRDDGEFEVTGLQYGAWYWIQDQENTAVASLMPKNILKNRKTPPADPGSSTITLSQAPSGAATFLKDTASGRVGILPNILPPPDEDPPPACGQYKEEDDDDETVKQLEDDCLIDASYYVRVTQGPGAGSDDAITSGQVFRPGTGTIALTLGLYGNGHLDVENPLGAGFATPLTVTLWEVAATIEGAVGPPQQLGAERVAGVTAASLNTASATLTIHGIAESDDLCSGNIPYDVELEIKASPGVNAVKPPIPSNDTAAGDLRPSAKLRVRCPGAAANRARSLVPDNPFPVGR